MCLAAALVTGIRGLLGREITLMLFGNREEHVGCAARYINIQAVCIFVQASDCEQFR